MQLKEQKRKGAIEEKERDREFFMQLATLLAKKSCLLHCHIFKLLLNFHVISLYLYLY